MGKEAVRTTPDQRIVRAALDTRRVINAPAQVSPREKTRGMAQQMRNELATLYPTMTAAEIAAKFGVSTSTVEDEAKNLIAAGLLEPKRPRKTQTPTPRANSAYEDRVALNAYETKTVTNARRLQIEQPNLTQEQLVALLAKESYGGSSRKPHSEVLKMITDTLIKLGIITQSEPTYFQPNEAAQGDIHYLKIANEKERARARDHMRANPITSHTDEAEENRLLTLQAQIKQQKNEGKTYRQIAADLGITLEDVTELGRL